MTAECKRVGHLRGTVPASEVNRLVIVIQALIANESVVCAFLVAIVNITSGDAAKANKATCGESVMHLVIGCMKAHADSERVLADGAVACRNLIVGNDTNMQHFIRLGGLVTLYAAAERHRAFEKLAVEVCAVTGACAASWWHYNDVVAANGAVHVFAALQSHASVPSVQELGCGALWNIAQYDKGKKQILAGGGVQHLRRAARLHAGSAEVMYAVKGALAALGVPVESPAPARTVDAAPPAASSSGGHSVAVEAPMAAEVVVPLPAAAPATAQV